MANKMDATEKKTRDNAVNILSLAAASLGIEFDVRVTDPKWSRERGMAVATVTGYVDGDYEITVRKVR